MRPAAMEGLPVLTTLNDTQWREGVCEKSQVKKGKMRMSEGGEEN